MQISFTPPLSIEIQKLSAQVSVINLNLILGMFMGIISSWKEI